MACPGVRPDTPSTPTNSIDNRDVLRTTGYNTALVVAGLPELAVPK